MAFVILLTLQIGKLFCGFVTEIFKRRCKAMEAKLNQLLERGSKSGPLCSFSGFNYGGFAIEVKGTGEGS